MKGERSRLFCVFDDLKKNISIYFCDYIFSKVYLKKYKRIARKIMENKGKYDILLNYIKIIFRKEYNT